MLGAKHGAAGMTTTPDKFKRAKAPRRASPGKRVTVSEEQRRAYEETVRGIEDREREHARFLPNDLKSKR
jgi:hypothetical protein